MPAVPGLRSNYAKVGRLVYVGRMFDKIRLHAAGNLPADYHANLGAGFDARACSFLRVGYAELRSRVLEGGTDDEILAWCEAKGGRRADDECLWWNSFMMKRGWRDEATPIMRQRIVEFGLEGRPIETMFDLNECDEGRDPMAERAWEKV